MKKGASHVDWAISMGIFLVFLLLTIIFLRPGTEPIYKGDTLLGIVEKGLKDDTYYTIEKQLLNINYLGSSDTWKIRIRKASNNGLNSNWINTDDIRNYTAVMNSSNDYGDIKWDVYNEYCDKEQPCGGYYPESNDKYVLDFETNLENGDNTFYVLHSDNFTYNTYVTGANGIYIDMKDDATPGTDEWTCSQCILDTKPGEDYNFTYDFGVSEIFKGFSEDKLNVLENVYYEDLKADWDVPKGVEFTINITNLSSYPADYTFGTEEEAPMQENIFVRELSSWILQGKATLVPVKVRIKVWSSVTVVLPPAPVELFFVKNPAGEDVAIFDNQGNMKLAGTCIVSTCDAPQNSFIIKNLNGDTVAYIDSNGDLCLESGNCNDHDTSCDSQGSSSFIIQNNLGANVAYINSNGELCLIGRLTENQSF